MDERGENGALEEHKEWYKHNSTFQEAREIVQDKGLEGFAGLAAEKMGRRKFIKTMGFVTAGLGLLGVPAFAEKKEEGAAPARKYKAAYSAILMAVFWVKAGAETLQHYGYLTGFDVDVFDAGGDPGTQRSQIDLIASKAGEYDVVFIHPSQIGAFTEPVKELINKGVVVVDIDTKLVPDLSTLDILTFTEPDNVWMGSAVTEYLCKKINYKGNIVHTQGALGHTGAQGRAKGFHQVISKYPDIKVIDETPCNWSAEKTRSVWSDLLVKYNRIDAGFFHNDDMALAAYSALKAAGREDECVLGGVDGMAPSLRELKKGKIQATATNPACRVHGYGFWAAWYHLVNEVPSADIPKFLRCDGPMVNVDLPEKVIDSFIWENEHYML
ncbi:MAG: sugar ABC transporter substrate-binding protein [Spirochaetota bacterium]